MLIGHARMLYLFDDLMDWTTVTDAGLDLA
jgi:hypothetical protein